jgi:4'-phosphopantetheinyl transferase
LISRALELKHDEVHVWRSIVGSDEQRLRELSATLAPDEADRASKFYFAADRNRYITAHAALRDVLGKYLDVHPAALIFRVNKYGKPELADRALCFNLSHSGERVLIAVARGREVGVDLELFAAARADLSVAEFYFAPGEVARLRALPVDQRSRGFFNCWTRKEAYIKAIGMGVSLPLDSFEVSLAPDEGAALIRTADLDDEHEWDLRDLSLGPDYVGALVTAGKVGKVVMRECEACDTERY